MRKKAHPRAEYFRRYRALNRDRRRAHKKVERAMEAGKLVRPLRCSKPDCRKVCRPQAHHDDYSKPLDVTWLCKKCHMAHHAALDRMRSTTAQPLKEND